MFTCRHRGEENGCPILTGQVFLGFGVSLCCHEGLISGGGKEVNRPLMLKPKTPTTAQEPGDHSGNGSHIVSLSYWKIDFGKCSWE